MKKAFDQTVRDLKREVNKKVLKVPSVEQKILDATSNEPWGPHGSLLADIAHASKNSYEYQMIMTVIWKRINDTGKNWRHVYKGLTVLDYLVAHGSERVIDEIKEHAYQISSLSEFQYIDSKGRDQGNNVRRKSQSLVALVNDKERIAEVREKALSNRDKYRSTFATDGNYRSGGRYDDDRYDSRYGSRDDERYGRERDGGYRDDDRYGRYGDRNGRDSEDRYTYRDDDYRGRNRDDDYKFGSRSRSAERDRDRPYDDEDRYSTRSGGGGGRSDGLSHEPRPLERKLSEPNISAPPSYEEATKDTRTPSNIPETERDERTSDIPAPKAPLPPQPKVSISETASTSPTVVAPAAVAPADPAVGPSTSTFNEGDAFDEFDPRGFVPGSGNSVDVDLFGSLSVEDSINSLALVPVSASTTTLEPDLPVNSGFDSNFVASSAGQPSSNPFGDAPFMAGQDNFAAQPQNNPSASFHAGYTSVGITASQAPVAPRVESSPGFYFGESFQAVSYPTNAPGFPPAVPAAQPSSDVLEGLFLPPGPAASFPPQGSLPRTQTAPAEFTMQTATPELLAQSGFSAPPPFQGAPPAYNAQPAMSSRSGLMPKAASTNQLASQGAPLSLLGTPLASQGATTAYSGAAAKAPQSKDKFETKSTVWADTISRGLVDLNISGPKTNPNASLGIDFDSLNRKEKREKEKSSAVPPVSTVSMGKAMGSGSGIGRVGATGLAPPPNPMMGSAMGMGGMGMGTYGGGMNQPMGMGMGMNMGMGMGIRPNPGMPPAPGMPGYNPMTGAGGYGSQPYGGYR